MKKIFKLFLVVFALLLIAPITLFGAESEKFYTITCNPGEETSSEMRINWHTDVDLTNSYVVYTKKSDTEWKDALTATTECVTNSAFKGLNASGEEFNQNGAVLSNLEKDTEYMYKITDGTDESDVRYFKTSGAAGFSFIWISDFHAYYDSGTRLSNASAVIQDALNIDNSVDFILSTGDTVAHGGTYKWWKQVSEASWMKNYMYVDVLGNHDWMTSAGTYVADGATNKFFDATHNNPKNGYAGQENVCYYFYYGDVLFICLNTEEYTAGQFEWAESVLKEADAQYIVMLQHYEAFGTSGKKAVGYNRWHELCDKYGVDLFLSGNSHCYIRSRSIYNDAVSTDSSKGTVYMVAPSSDGDRGVSFNGITQNADIVAKGWAGGTYQVACSIVSVTSNSITTKLINKGGDIIDSGMVLPKRAPTSRTTKDVADIDRSALESTFELQVNTRNITTPKLKYSEEAYKAIRKLTISIENTNEIVYEGMIKANSDALEIPNLAKGLHNLKFEFEYYDNVVNTKIVEFANVPRWGSITDINSTVEDNDVTISWKGSITKDRVEKLEVYLNDELTETLDISTKKLVLTDLAKGTYKVVLKVVDKDGDVLAKITLDEVTIEKEEVKYTVVFKDENGDVIKSEEVIEGKSATAPDALTKEGFIFKGWDQDFTNVTSNLEIKPVFEAIEYKIIFKDKAGNLIKEVTVKHGEKAIAPDAPAVEGYTFTGWDKDITNVTSNLEVKALYDVALYKVTFKDKAGNVITEVTVKHGEAVVAPDAPAVEGYTFTGWDKAFDSITSDTVVTAVYKAKGGCGNSATVLWMSLLFVAFVIIRRKK